MLGWATVTCYATRSVSSVLRHAPDLTTSHIPAHFDWVSAPGLGREGYAYQVQSIALKYAANGDVEAAVYLSDDSRQV